MGGHPPGAVRPLTCRDTDLSETLIDETRNTGDLKVAGRRGRVDPEELRGAVEAVWGWVRGDEPEPPRDAVARAVRLSLRTLAQVAPGATVEVRVPPFAAVQCVAGPRHTRGTPPNVVETDPRTWLRLATGDLAWSDALSDHMVAASGTRADVAGWLPLVRPIA